MNSKSIGLLLLSFLFLKVDAQQATKIKFNGFDQIAYVKSLDKLFFRGYGDYEGVYSFKLPTNEFQKESFLGEEIPTGLDLKVSPDGQFLYTTESQRIAKYSLPDLTFVEDFLLPEDKSVMSIAISSLDPDLIAIRQRNGSSSNEMALYQNGIELPNVFDHYASVYSFNFSDNKNLLYVKKAGYMFILPFDDMGLITNDTSYYTFPGVSDFNTYNNRIYSQGGAVIDVTDEIPVFSGQHTHRIQNAVGESAIHFATSTLGYYATLMDTTANQIIQVREASSSTLDLMYFDMETLVLLDVKSIKAPLPNGKVTQFKNGVNFAYYTEERDLVIVRDTDCDPAMALNVDSLFDSPILSCNNYPTVFPPAGYDRIYDEDGFQYDSINLYMGPSNSFMLMDEQGCLSQLATIVIKHTQSPNQTPRILSVDNDDSNQISIDRCIGDKTYLRAKSNFDTDEYSYIWSTGEIGREIAIDDDVEFVYVYKFRLLHCKSEPSDTFFINTHEGIIPPPPEFKIENDIATICDNSSVILRGEEGYEKYRWYNATTGSSRIGLSYTVSEEANLFLQAKNAEGCWSDFNHIHVHEIDDVDFPTPQIRRLANLLSANTPATHFQWYRNGELIPDSNHPFHEATETGYYKMKIGNGLCWSSFSSSIIIP